MSLAEPSDDTVAAAGAAEPAGVGAFAFRDDELSAAALIAGAKHSSRCGAFHDVADAVSRIRLQLRICLRWDRSDRLPHDFGGQAVLCSPARPEIVESPLPGLGRGAIYGIELAAKLLIFPALCDHPHGRQGRCALDHAASGSAGSRIGSERAQSSASSARMTVRPPTFRAFSRPAPISSYILVGPMP